MMLLLNAKGPHPRGEGKRRTRLCLLIAAFMAFSPLAHAFDLQQLSEQLAKPHVIHGDFIQEKHLRALPKPLTSTGTFVLAKDHGLLWQLKTPLQQDYRITPRASPGVTARSGRCFPAKALARNRTGCSSRCCKATAVACNGISTCNCKAKPITGT